MAHGYTFERDGEGYRFYSDMQGGSTSLARAKPLFIEGNGPIWASILLIGLAVYSGKLLNIVVLFCIAGVLLYKRFKGHTPSQGATNAGAGKAGLLVAVDGIVTEGGERIAATRINSIDVKNEMDAAIASFAGSRTQYKAGSGMAAMDAVGHDVRTKKAKTRFTVSIQHGASETIVARRLDRNGAQGLQADIQRVLQGQSLA